MSVPLTIATIDYDHFRDFRLGLVCAEGIEPIWLTLGHHEIFSRFTFNREWDVSELSFAKFMAQVTRSDADIIGLPVYASRLFRFSSFYVNHNKGVKSAKDLRGKRIGVPEWAHTAAVYMRGWLMNEGGVALSDIDWVQAGTNEAGRIEKVELSLPKGVKLTSAPSADFVLVDDGESGVCDGAVENIRLDSAASKPDLTVALSHDAADYKLYVRSPRFSAQDAAAFFAVMWRSARARTVAVN